jgi:hypothetical protein
MIKVEHTKLYNILQHIKNVDGVLNRLVTDAELVLVAGYYPKCKVIQLKGNVYHPILVSRTEKIEVGDWTLVNGKLEQVLQMQLGEDGIWQYRTNTAWFSNCVKVIALPEHFSPEQLQMIVDGKLKEGKCLVECDKRFSVHGDKHSNTDKPSDYSIIKLNPHITIYPVEEKMVAISLVEKAFDAGFSRGVFIESAGYNISYKPLSKKSGLNKMLNNMKTIIIIMLMIL